MSNPYVGEIRLFAGAYAPAGWSTCAGQQMQISGNEALYAIMGTRYGGDGRTTFNLPDLRGLLVCGTGQAPGSLNNYALGQSFGAAVVTVSEAQMPSHTHPITASNQTATATNPSNAVFALPATVPEYVNATATGFAVRNMAATALTTSGAGAGHGNLMPTLAVTYIIALRGIYPTPQ